MVWKKIGEVLPMMQGDAYLLGINIVMVIMSEGLNKKAGTN